MPVNTKHPDYEGAIGKWSRVRAAVDGEDAVKAKGAEFLPVLDGMTNEGAIIPGAMGGTSHGKEYQAYKLRASFFEAPERTLQGLAGAVMRKVPDIDVPPALDPVLARATLRGDSLDQFTRQIVLEQISVGRMFAVTDILVDPISKNVVRPYAVLYKAEELINWRTSTINGAETLSLVVVREDIEKEGEDAFTAEHCEAYRVFRAGNPFTGGPLSDEELDHLGIGQEDWLKAAEAGDHEDHVSSLLAFHKLDPSHLKNALHWQEVHEAATDAAGGTKQDEFAFVSRTFPKRAGGHPWTTIPGEIINALEVGSDVQRPPLLPVCNLALSHYRNSADYEHGMHFTALPTAWAAGFDVGKDSSLEIGSTVAWIGETGARAGYLEFTGAGLRSIMEAMEAKERRMAVVGARFLEEQAQSQQDTATAVRYRHSGDKSMLAVIADTASEGVTKLLGYMLQWMTSGPVPQDVLDGITYQLHTDFNPNGLDPQACAVLLQKLVAGSISFDTYFFNMQRGEMYPDGWTPDDEKRAMAESRDLLGVGDETVESNTTEEGPEEEEGGEGSGDQEDGEEEEEQS